jgi:hypothetical protein
MALLSYNFEVVNQNVVQQALASIERRVAQHNTRMRRELGGTPVARARTITTTGSTISERITRRVTEEQRAAKQTELYWQRAAQRAADYRIRQDEKAHRQKLALIAKEERAMKLAAAQLDRQRSRAIFATSRGEERERKRVSRAIVGGVGRSAVGALGATGRYAGAALGIAGGFAMGSAIQTRLSESAQAARLANKAGKPEDKRRLLAQANDVVGLTGTQKLSSLDAFVGETGNLDVAEKLMPRMGKLSRVFGADPEQLMKAAGQSFNVLKDSIKDPIELVQELGRVMETFAAQGNMGSIELEDLSGILGGLGNVTRQFKGEASGLMTQVGALAQLVKARGGADTAAEAATALSRVPKDIIQNRKRFAAAGIDIRDKASGKLADPTEVLIRTLEKTKGDQFKIAPLFNIESMKAIESVRTVYTDAEKKEKGSGRAAVLAEVERFGSAGFKPGELDVMDKSVTSEASTQLIEAQKKFNAALGSELLPVITRMIPEFTRLIPTVAKAADVVARFVESVAKDPISGIGKIIAAKVAIDLAGAGIGSVVKASLERLLSGALAGGAFGGGGAPVAGVGAGAGAGVALAGTGAIVGVGAAVYQANELGKQTDGLDGFLAGIGGLLSGDGFAAGVDAHMNAEAYDRAQDPFSKEYIPPVELTGEGTGRRTLPDGMSVVNTKGERVNFDSLSLDQQKALLDQAANALTSAAGALDGAATKLEKAGVNRTNKPSSPVTN